MTLRDLKEHAEQTIAALREHGKSPKENNLYDYKLKLNLYGLTDSLEIFVRNFAKDILSFSNGNGGIVLLGINEDKNTGELGDVGLDRENLEHLGKIDLSYLSQKFEKICKVGLDIDLQIFQLGMRKFYFVLIAKQNQVVIPVNDFPDYGLKKGEIVYRVSGKNEIANQSAQEFNRFLQVKSNEKSKEFMEIWSKLLPEMFDINPREILIINPKSNRVYGFNGKDNVLSGSDIEIDKSDTGVFNIILNAISAGEIGKISDNEGKPLYKIVGEVKSVAVREFISISTLQEKVKDKSLFKFTNQQLKSAIKYPGWVNDEHFQVVNPPDGTVISGFERYIWVELLDKTRKVVCSNESIEEILKVINNGEIHMVIFNKNLDSKKL